MFPLRTKSLILGAAFISACGGGNSPETAPAPQPAEKTENTVLSSAIVNSGDIPIEKILANNVPGVTIGHASDGSLTVRIRGSASWNPDNQPLYIIDGVAITPGPGGALAGISPYDIAEIKVLKDAANMSMYGSRGANGVILIKTKHH